MLFGFQQTMAQEGKTSKVHITISEGDEVTTDTTFELKEGQDPEMVKKIISHLAGEDVHKVHVSKDKKMVWVSSGGDDDWHIKEGLEAINIDSIREAHKDAKVLVIKNKDGDITVKELDEDDDIYFDDDCDAHHEMMFLEADEDGKTIHIKKMKSGKKVMMISEDDDVHKAHKIIVHTEKGDCEEKEIKVTVHTDDDIECVEKGEGDEHVEVYVIKKDDGEEVKVMKKKIKVEIEEEEDTGEKKEKAEKKKKK
jgi:hypothetical protein